MSDNPGGDHHRYAGKPRIIPAARRLSVRQCGFIFRSNLVNPTIKDATQPRIMRKNLTGSHS